jgi:hypothetical protein
MNEVQIELNHDNEPKKQGNDNSDGFNAASSVVQMFTTEHVKTWGFSNVNNKKGKRMGELIDSFD